MRFYVWLHSFDWNWYILKSTHMNVNCRICKSCDRFLWGCFNLPWNFVFVTQYVINQKRPTNICNIQFTTSLISNYTIYANIIQIIKWDKCCDSFSYFHLRNIVSLGKYIFYFSQFVLFKYVYECMNNHYTN